MMSTKSFGYQKEYHLTIRSKPQTQKSIRDTYARQREDRLEKQQQRYSINAQNIEFRTPTEWTSLEVLVWLKSVNLGVLHDTFAKSHINGRKLLELDTQDMNDLGIKSLGHRKLLSKRIEELKAKLLGNDHVRSGDEKVMAPRMQHWSQIKPLAENEVKDDGGSGSINLGDGTFDEAYEREAFQKAVMEWRAANATNEPKKSSLLDHSAGETWTNPFAK